MSTPTLAEMDRDGPLPVLAELPMVVPVVQEELTVGTRWVDAGGVRLRKTVHADAVTVDVPLRCESVGVQRVPVGRVVDGPVSVRWEGEVMIVPVVEERLVVTKQLVLVEELHVTRTEHLRHAPQDVVTRREEVIVERIDAAPRPTADIG